MTQNGNSNNNTIKNEKRDGTVRKTSGTKTTDVKSSGKKASAKKASGKKASAKKASAKAVSKTSKESVKKTAKAPDFGKNAKKKTKAVANKSREDTKRGVSKTGAKGYKKIDKKPDKVKNKKPAPKDTKKEITKDMTAKRPGDNQAATVALNAVTFILNTVLTVIFYIIVVLAVVKACNTVYEFGYQIYGNVSVEAAPGHTVNIVIEDGETTMNVASKLEMNNVIENKYTFYIRTKLSGKSIFPGTYQVNSSMNYQQILDVIADYDTALENLEDKAKEQ